jgi:hypothetical protein
MILPGPTIEDQLQKLIYNMAFLLLITWEESKTVVGFHTFQAQKSQKPSLLSRAGEPTRRNPHTATHHLLLVKAP